MAHLQYIPGDPRLVDQLVYELKSKGIFDQFRKDCIADVDTRPAYQNLRQRVENSVSTFLSRQCWKPDLNKNQLREKLRKHILDGNYLEQGVERIVDQVVNPKVASVFIPQVEDLVYNYLGITRKKTTPVAETSNGKVTGNDLLPTDLEAVSPGSVKSNEDKTEAMEISQSSEIFKMEADIEKTKNEKEHTVNDIDKEKTDETRLSGISELTSNDSMTSIDKNSIPLPNEEVKLENIPEPNNSPPISTKIKVELEKIELPQEPNISTDIPLPDETPKSEKETEFKPINSDNDDSSSDSSLRRNMSPLTPIRNFNNENSCDAQQAFENEDNKEDKKDTLEPSTFRFTIEAKVTENSSDTVKIEKKEIEQANLSFQFNNQVNINTFNTPMYDDSSNSTHLQIDYESDANSKTNVENKVPEPDLNSGDSRKDKKSEEKKSSHRSSHNRDSHRHSSSKDRRTDSKQSSSKDSKSDRKSSKDDHKSSSKSSHKEKSSERDKRDERKDRDSSKHRSLHKSSSSSTHKDSKSHRSSSSSQRHSSSSKHTDEKRSSSSSHRDKSERSSDKYSKEKSSKESKSSSSSHRTDKDRKSSSSSKTKSDDKERQKKDKKETDDHYSASGRGNHTRRSTDRDSNDGSSSSKGSQHPASSKSSENKKESKGSTSKSDSISTSGDSTSPCDKDIEILTEKTKNESKSQNKDVPQVKPIVRIENHLETPISSPPRLPFVPDVTLKKPKFAANMQEARKLMKMRKFLDEEQKRMNQEAALLLEFQANVRPSLSQVYSSIPGPELEFACVTNNQGEMTIRDNQIHSDTITSAIDDNAETRNDTISDILCAAQQVENIEEDNEVQNTEENSLEKQKIKLENVPSDSKVIVDKSEIDDEVNQQSDTATVQIENILEADITSCEMDVDTTIDEKKIQIIDNIFTDVIDHSDKISNDDKNKVQCDTINGDLQATIEVKNQEDEIPDSDGIEAQLQSLMQDDDNKRSEYFQVTIITEELSESEEVDYKPDTITEVNDNPELVIQIEDEICPNEPAFEYFAEHEKYNAELERDRFSKFLKSFTERSFSDKIHLINCDSYEESIIKEASESFGDFEIINYYKNGHLKLNTAKNIVRNINVSSEISLPVEKNNSSLISPSPMFSPMKSECSFELSSDYDAKLEEMVSKTSRKEIMEIILGNVTDETTSETGEMPTIDYCMESNIESDTENTMKRKFCEVESSVNNKRQVLTPNKIRKLSGSEQISSTTEESEEMSNNNGPNPMRSKYLGRARRVGLPRPRRTNLPNSPSSDKSVENYEQNTAQTNGRLKPRKVQRYDTSDLYKPKLHYLSRRNNIS